MDTNEERDWQAVVEAQQRQIDALRTEVEALRRRVEPATAAPGPAATPPSGTATAPTDTDTDTGAAAMGRRALLGRAGAAAAAATGGMLLAGGTSRPAAAATGGNFILGVANSADAMTILTSTAGAANTRFLVRDDGTIGTTNGGYGVIKALGTQGLSAALVGHTTGQQAAGVVGSATATGAVGAVFGGPDDGSDARLNPGGPAPVTRLTHKHQAGDLVHDGNGDLWVCVASGASVGVPGTWRKLAGPDSAGSFHPLPVPVRVFDSRAGFAPANVAKGAFTNQTKVLNAANNGSGVAAGATAVLVNFAVTNTNTGGFGALWANGFAYPGTASINWGLANTTISNSVVTAVDGARNFQCRIVGTADVIVDVVGYYR